MAQKKTTELNNEELEKRIDELKTELSGLSKVLNEQKEIAVEKGSEFLAHAKDKISETVSAAKTIYQDDVDVLKEHCDKVGTKIKENPLATAAIAAGIGLVVGAIANAKKHK